MKYLTVTKMEKLYWQDAYQKECEARVTRVDGNKVYLDKTVAFAFSGGQQSDTAFINDEQLVELVSEGKETAHVFTDAPSVNEGDSVKVRIDWEKRYRIMRLHSAAHVVHYFVLEAIGDKKPIGSNITQDKARVDYAYSESIGPLLPAIEGKVNAFNAESHAIVTRDGDEPGRRLWACDQWLMPCGGTHVRGTSEIGALRLKRKNTGAGKERVEISLQ
jgi:Ser-tRNA(Ala) deacylase AlaX